MDKFIEPTDEEISDFFGGIQFVSYRPEDLPHFRPDHQYTQQEYEDRCNAVINYYLRLHIAPDKFINAENLVSAHATTSNPSLHTYAFGKGQRTLFAMLRPSLHPGTESQDLENYFVAPQRSCIPPDHMRYLIVLHEIGHIRQDLQNTRLLRRDEQETDADIFSLRSYIQNGGKKEVVSEHIQRRALCALMSSSDNYMMAPILEALFEKNQSEIPHVVDVWGAYKSIRGQIRLELHRQDKFRHHDYINSELSDYGQEAHPYIFSILKKMRGEEKPPLERSIIELTLKAAKNLVPHMLNEPADIQHIHWPVIERLGDRLSLDEFRENADKRHAEFKARSQEKQREFLKRMGSMDPFINEWIHK